jgi:hypothetical protein
MKKKTSKKDKVSKFPLPKPIELAKLAGILGPNFQRPAEALKVAMEWYFEAVLFARELPSTPEELLIKFGSQERQLEVILGPIKKDFKAMWADTLELDPKKDDDPARQYLAEHGLSLKTARSVLDNFRRCRNRPLPVYRKYSIPSADGIIARFERVTNGQKTYAIPKFVLDDIICYHKDGRLLQMRESWHKRKAAKSLRSKTRKTKIKKSSVERA